MINVPWYWAEKSGDINWLQDLRESHLRKYCHLIYMYNTGISYTQRHTMILLGFFMSVVDAAAAAFIFVLFDKRWILFRHQNRPVLGSDDGVSDSNDSRGPGNRVPAMERLNAILPQQLERRRDMPLCFQQRLLRSGRYVHFEITLPGNCLISTLMLLGYIPIYIWCYVRLLRLEVIGKRWKYPDQHLLPPLSHSTCTKYIQHKCQLQM